LGSNTMTGPEACSVRSGRRSPRRAEQLRCAALASWIGGSRDISTLVCADRWKRHAHRRAGGPTRRSMMPELAGGVAESPA